MAINPKGKWIHQARLSIRSDSVDGGSIPDDEIQADFIISNNEVDGHNSIMTEKTLRNYVEDAANGVPFMDGHGDDLQKQLGQTIAASYNESEKQAIATIRMLRDSDDTPENMRVNEYIRRMERGLYNSVSVAFRDADETCNICGKDIFDWSRDDPCPHIPGRSYNGQMCTYNVDNARLRHVGLVSQPSNPNAKLLDTREWVEDLAKIKTQGEIGAGESSDPKTLLERDGLKWRQSLIDIAIAEGIRAEDNFNEEQWRGWLSNMESEQIVAQTNSWKTIGDNRWGEGGRVTQSITDGELNHGQRNESAIVLPNWLFG